MGIRITIYRALELLIFAQDTKVSTSDHCEMSLVQICGLNTKMSKAAHFFPFCPQYMDDHRQHCVTYANFHVRKVNIAMYGNISDTYFSFQ